MTAVSRAINSARHRMTCPMLVRLALLLLGCAMMPVPGLAQVQLLPPPAGTPDLPEIPSPAPAPSAPSGFVVENLGSVDAEAVGALAQDEESLPAALWGDLSRDAIAALIDHLPTGTSLPSARSLTRRLLLSAATVPPNGSGPEISILQARIDALVRLGFASEAASLAAIGANALDTPDGHITIARAQLAAFDLPAACGTTVRAGEEAVALFWQKLLAFCQAAAGQKDQASLAAQTLFDRGGENDPLYFSLMDTLTLDLAPDVAGMTAKGPLHFAMLRMADATPPGGSDDPGIALLAAQKSDDLAMAEDAVLRGLMSPDDLAAKYLAQKFDTASLEAPLEVLDNLSGPMGRALLYQVMRNWDIPALKAEAITAALDHARRDGLLIVVAPVVKGPAMDIPPSSDLLWFAEDAARLFYLSGDVAQARLWHVLLRNAAPLDPAMAAADARLWHLAVLSGESGLALGRAKRGWFDAIVAGAEVPEDGAAHGAFLEALVGAATGANALSGDAGLRARAMTAPVEIGPGASALTLHMMARAAESENVGEAIALALAALAAAPAEDANRAGLVAVVQALARAGLLKDARRLAIEAAVLAAPDPVASQQ